MLAAALKPLGCTVVPYHVLELPSKKPGHPYVSDVVIKGQLECESESSSGSGSDTQSAALITTVANKESIVMVIECKKTVSASLVMIEPNEVIEMFIYCRYLLEIREQTNITGVLTDSINWHCFYLQKSEQLMSISKYLTFSSKKDSEVIATLPQLIS